MSCAAVEPVVCMHSGADVCCIHQMHWHALRAMHACNMPQAKIPQTKMPETKTLQTKLPHFWGPHVGSVPAWTAATQHAPSQTAERPSFEPTFRLHVQPQYLKAPPTKFTNKQSRLELKHTMRIIHTLASHLNSNHCVQQQNCSLAHCHQCSKDRPQLCKSHVMGVWHLSRALS